MISLCKIYRWHVRVESSAFERFHVGLPWKTCELSLGMRLARGRDAAPLSDSLITDGRVIKNTWRKPYKESSHQLHDTITIRGSKRLKEDTRRHSTWDKSLHAFKALVRRHLNSPELPPAWFVLPRRYHIGSIVSSRLSFYYCFSKTLSLAIEIRPRRIPFTMSW